MTADEGGTAAAHRISDGITPSLFAIKRSMGARDSAPRTGFLSMTTHHLAEAEVRHITDL